MRTVLITGCGGAASINYTRSLKESGCWYRLVGVDIDKYRIHRHECDISYLCPKANDPKYIPYLKEIIKKENIDFIHTQPEIEVYTIGKNRDEILQTGCKLFFPAQKTIDLLRDKSKSYEVWKKAGIKVPENISINNEDDLILAFEKFGKDIWIRETIGAAGKGSMSRPSFGFAREYINSKGSWGRVVAAQHLSDRTTTWQSLWHDGKLVVAQERKRMYWEMANRTQSGVTGLTGTGKTNDDPKVSDLAIKCIKAADSCPNGIFSVDFTYDYFGVPNPTEINIGKFFTTHNFVSRAGCNMPQIMIELCFGEYEGKYGIINPCPTGLYWVRGMDVAPKLINGELIKDKENEYNRIIEKL